MKPYQILFSFMRGRRGDVIHVSDEHAPGLLEAGLITPVTEDTPEARETKVIAPETKEGEGAPTEQRRTRRKSAEPDGG